MRNSEDDVARCFAERSAQARRETLQRDMHFGYSRGRMEIATAVSAPPVFEDARVLTAAKIEHGSVLRIDFPSSDLTHALGIVRDNLKRCGAGQVAVSTRKPEGVLPGSAIF